MEFVTTGDGSLTCFNQEAGELYHNRAGAYTEALLNYVLPSQALEHLAVSHELRLLDACFGLGYNTLVLLERAIAFNLRGEIDIVAVDFDDTIFGAVNTILASERFSQLRTLFGELHPGLQTIEYDGLRISMLVIGDDLRRLVPKVTTDFDRVFHDPFSPRKVPELWSIDLFRHYHRLLRARTGSILTYSSAGAVRGGLLQAGFQVYKTAGVGAKPGGTIAAVQAFDKLPQHVHALSDSEAQKLKGASGVPYRDPDLVLPRGLILERRQEEQSSASYP